jgi:WD40 repeat protein
MGFWEGAPKSNVVDMVFSAAIDVTSLLGEAPAPAPAPAKAPEPEEEEVSDTIPMNLHENLIAWNDDKEDFYYDIDKVRSNIKEVDKEEDEEERLDLNALHHSFSLEGHTRGNLHILDENTLLTSVGNAVLTIDVNTLDRSYIQGFSGAGIGALCVHPSGKYFAVGDKGKHPNVLIFEFPSMKLYRILRRGTEQAYSCLRFNPDGTKLATVGSAPDYLLTVWNWKTEMIVLKNKAFSQTLFDVVFSPYQSGEIVTSGTGHIRFWKMANTFTGMKLQGALGKFGRIDLSDVCAFVEFPDGKVLSGSISGQLLVWDGGQTKLQLSRKGGAPCHNGNIEVCYKEGNEFFTGGADGWIRVWDFDTFDQAELSDDATENYIEVEPLREVYVGDDVSIMGMVKRPDAGDWLVQCANGGLYKVPFHGEDSTKLLSFHAGPVVGIVTSPRAPLAVTAGEDGTIRLYDYLQRRELHQSAFNKAASKLIWVPKEAEPSVGGSVAVGFSDGVLRLLSVNRETGFKLLAATKPHSGKINALEFSPDGKQLATAGEDGVLFFFKFVGTLSNIKPVGFLYPTEEHHAINSISWSPDSKKLLVGSHDGSVMEYVGPGGTDYDVSKSFEIELEGKPYVFQRPVEAAPEPEGEPEPEPEDGGELQDGTEAGAPWNEDEAEEEEVIILPPEPALCVKYIGTLGNFLLTLDGVDSKKLYECSFDVEFPLRVVDAHAHPITDIVPSTSGDYLLTGCKGGVVQVRSKDFNGHVYESKMHDRHYGAIGGMATSYDERFLLTAGADSNIFLVDISFAEQMVVEANLMLGTVDMVPEPPVPVMDIVDEKAYSIEEEKQESEKDAMISKAEASKYNVRQYLAELRKEFEELRSSNNSLPDGARLTDEDFDIDPKLGDVLEAERQAKLADATAEMAWDKEKSELLLGKLQSTFIDPLVVEDITIHGLRNGREVTAFKVTRLPPELEESMAAVEGLLNSSEAEGDAAADAAVAEVAADPDAAADAGEAEASPTAKTGLGETGMTEGEDRHEARKQARAKRQGEMAQLMSEKIGDNYENPDDIAEIQYAQATWASSI